MDETRIYSVDSETFNKLSHANDELIQYLQWLIERKDLEAINKLSPIVRRTTDLFPATLESSHSGILKREQVQCINIMWDLSPFHNLFMQSRSSLDLH